MLSYVQWVGHYDEDSMTADVKLSKGQKWGCPLSSFRFKKTKSILGVSSFEPIFGNFRSHWWDAGFVYGTTKEAVAQGREGRGGRMRTSGSRFQLSYTPDGAPLVGDVKNSCKLQFDQTFYVDGRVVF